MRNTDPGGDALDRNVTRCNDLAGRASRLRGWPDFFCFVPAGRGGGLLGHFRDSPMRAVDRQDPAPVNGRLSAPPAACSSRLMRS
jgi:hypothetical protein